MPDPEPCRQLFRPPEELHLSVLRRHAQVEDTQRNHTVRCMYILRTGLI